AGRADLERPENYRWMVGTLKKLGAMSARGSVRRRLREERWSAGNTKHSIVSEPVVNSEVPSTWRRHPAFKELPPSLKQVAMLALSGHDRREITWLLDLSDTALRKRIS